MQDTSRQKVIFDQCKAWSLIRQESNSHFHVSFIFIVKALEAIVYSFHKDEIS